MTTLSELNTELWLAVGEAKHNSDAHHVQFDRADAFDAAWPIIKRLHGELEAARKENP